MVHKVQESRTMTQTAVSNTHSEIDCFLSPRLQASQLVSILDPLSYDHGYLSKP